MILDLKMNSSPRRNKKVVNLRVELTNKTKRQQWRPLDWPSKPKKKFRPLLPKMRRSRPKKLNKCQPLSKRKSPS
jgi:hypothetical protein